MLTGPLVEKMEAPPPDRFDCGRADQNDFLHEHAWADQQANVTTTYLVWHHGIVAGFATMCMSGIALDRRERGREVRFQDVSALKLAQLGIDRSFQGSGLGRFAVVWTVELARTVAAEVACRYVILDAQPDLVPWYQQLGFVANKLAQKRRIADALQHGRDPGRIAVSMRFDLRGLGE